MRMLLAKSVLVCLACAQASLARVSVAANSVGQTPRRELAITIDDLPSALQSDVRVTRDETARILAALKRHRAPAVGFVNENKLHVAGEVDERIDLLRMWLDAGVPLGNHTFSHVKFQDTPLWQYEDEVIRGEVVTRRLMRERGFQRLYFRHPYTSTGPTREAKEQFEAFLAERGYRVAPFTVEHADYIFNSVYVHALEAKDAATAERIRAAYIRHIDTACEYAERRSRELFGREIRQVLLIHANRINADALDETLARLKARGYSFVTLDAALEDKAYQTRDDYVGPLGISWLHRWSTALGAENKYREEPDPPKFVFDLLHAARAR
jgi:peptidoglycan-N-acetylglucosamine deacetylase